MTTTVKSQAADKPKAAKTAKDVSDFLKAGVQFGHETRRWNPKMQKYIFAEKNNIHIIDISKTAEMLEKAVSFLERVATEGEVLFVGTKRQAGDIVKEQAVKSGSYYIVNRWPGGLLTNFGQIKSSLKRLKELEKDFEEGVEGRTKFEVSNMKKEWVKLNRLYEGIKNMAVFPKTVVVVDINYERNVVTEAKKLGIPVVAIVDTNTDPEAIDYPIPGNDDAISSLKLLITTLAEAVARGNKGKGVKHEFTDYSKFEVKIIKVEQEAEKLVEVGEAVLEKQPEPRKVVKVETRKKDSSKGILENIQKAKEVKQRVKASEEREKN